MRIMFGLGSKDVFPYFFFGFKSQKQKDHEFFGGVSHFRWNTFWFVVLVLCVRNPNHSLERLAWCTCLHLNPCAAAVLHFMRNTMHMNSILFFLFLGIRLNSSCLCRQRWILRHRKFSCSRWNCRGCWSCRVRCHELLESPRQGLMHSLG